MPETIGDRITQALAARGKRPADLARACDVTPTSVSDWQSGKTKGLKPENLVCAAKFLGVRIEWIVNGDLPMDTQDTANVDPGPRMRGTVPLISWVRAGMWDDAMDLFQPGDAEDWLNCTKPHSESAYALRVRGKSMTSPYPEAKSYKEGDIIFVDPQQKAPANGQRIIAKIKGSDEVTFKTFVQEEGRVWLKPINPQYPPILDPFQILGTVIGKWEDE